MDKIEKPKMEKPGMEDKKGRKGSGHTAEEKCRAVLSVWTERRKLGEVCRELGVTWTVLSQWQARAMEGMLQALESRVNLTKGEALSPRLQALLANRHKMLNTRKLSRRLEQIQLARKEEVVPQPQ